MSDRIRFDPTGLPPERPENSLDRFRDRGAPEADALLAHLSIDQLRAGLKKGRDDLALLDALDTMDHETMHHDIGHPGRHPGRAYEAWVQNDSEKRRLLLNSAVRQVEQELRRRGESF